MTGIDIIQAAMAARKAQGLSVETSGFSWAPPSHTHVRHCTDLADRDAYIERCRARGETVRILGAA